MRALFLIVFIAILLVINWLIYKTTASAFFITDRRGLVALGAGLGIGIAGFIAITLAASRFYNPLVRVLYAAFASWFGVMGYLFLASILFWIIISVARTFGLNVNAVILFEILLAAVLCLCIYGVYNANQIRIKELQASLPNLPAEWHGKRAVFVSDLHVGDIRNLSFAKMIAARISSMNPDIVFIGGDFYDGVAVDAPVLAKPFGEINSPLGVYFITGNHEEFAAESAKVYTDAMRSAGIKVLDNEKIIADGVQILGVDYKQSGNRAKFSSILDDLKISAQMPSILLKHDPNELDIAEGHGISMTISGHTHAGQVWPVNYLTRIVYKGYDYGLMKLGRMDVYTSSGVGTWGPPMRVGANPEIVLIRF